MNILIGSDLHGSKKYAGMFVDVIEKIHPDKIFLLGDLYYNGPRNNLPEQYDPKEVVPLLNRYAEIITAVRGNCDSEVDQMVSDFKIEERVTLYHFDKEIRLEHGHHLDLNNIEKDFDGVLFYGHTHVGLTERKDRYIVANPGSISIPKDGHHSYILMNEKGIYRYDLISDQLLSYLDF